MLALMLSLFAFAATPLDDVPTLAHAAIEGDASAVARACARSGSRGSIAWCSCGASCPSVPPLFTGPVTPRVKAWEALVDAVARQKYASASGLYWLHPPRGGPGGGEGPAQANPVAAPARRSRPGLLVRQLALLPHHPLCRPVIAKALHDGWVLHWQSVRKVPTIAIDFGDGRKLTRTITGNSLHYAMTADGDIVEVMPGMVGPGAFASWLGDAAAVNTQSPPTRPASARRASAPTSARSTRTGSTLARGAEGARAGGRERPRRCWRTR